ncbi:hypothetical protein BV898_03285 [Hypsibius exemplaris]|uniref:Uncharacterized protein n=1 Tax=Hypsibius exemplaris TaxID=2072580 RepID=A0A1W0X5U2_HYPEX|nr:hypothetical protein BV898_03285 [Hypsibius exemplaris]
MPGPRKKHAIPEHEKAVFWPVKSTLNNATGVILNTLWDVEVAALRTIKQDKSMTALSCVGSLLPKEKGSEGKHRDVEEKMKKWLDGKGDRSVVYVSFGSVAIPLKEQITEIGKALLVLGVWSLKEYYHRDRAVRRGGAYSGDRKQGSEDCFGDETNAAINEVGNWNEESDYTKSSYFQVAQALGVKLGEFRDLMKVIALSSD